MTKEEGLKQIDEVIAQGPFKDSWESLCLYKVPQWYTDAKFGIFIHWGVYSVPAFGNEWYPHNMYVKGSKEFEHHIKTWGPHNKFGYKDFIPLFKGEKFDAKEWIQLFKDAGAKYVMPVAEHHDGFSLYDCGYSTWKAPVMGPKRDVIGELKKAADDAGIVFSVSYHRAEHCWFFNGGREYECDITDPAYEDFYEKQQDGGDDTHNIYSVPPNKEHCDDWLVRICELVDKYHPGIVWFDWWIHNTGWKPYIKKFAAYYYNRAAQRGEEVAINYKYNAYAYGSAVFDVERGQLAGIRPMLWQTDTAAAKNSWGYTDNNDFKDPVDIVGDLIDIVSKNGVLLLNIGPRSDGSITAEDRNILLAIGDWLKKNGEGIYGTTHWQWFGEGPTEISGGAFKDTDRRAFTASDFRFTYKRGTLYAFVMKYPGDGKVTIPSLKRSASAQGIGDFGIEAVSLLGYGNRVSFERDTEALRLTVDGSIETEYPVGFAVKID
ncbi:MAG: alpha-L-fucosidase [Spirochaetaceae bacterium]|jgi:alpha-L-fucosidase|nr:alpha-L-fucosidase [Spirochaetaceae bacterium]